MRINVTIEWEQWQVDNYVKRLAITQTMVNDGCVLLWLNLNWILNTFKRVWSLRENLELQILIKVQKTNIDLTSWCYQHFFVFTTPRTSSSASWDFKQYSTKAPREMFQHKKSKWFYKAPIIGSSWSPFLIERKHYFHKWKVCLLL